MTVEVVRLYTPCCKALVEGFAEDGPEKRCVARDCPACGAGWVFTDRPQRGIIDAERRPA